MQLIDTVKFQSWSKPFSATSARIPIMVVLKKFAMGPVVEGCYNTWNLVQTTRRQHVSTSAFSNRWPALETASNWVLCASLQPFYCSLWQSGDGDRQETHLSYEMTEMVTRQNRKQWFQWTITVANIFTLYTHSRLVTTLFWNRPSLHKWTNIYTIFSQWWQDWEVQQLGCSDMPTCYKRSNGDYTYSHGTSLKLTWFITMEVSLDNCKCSVYFDTEGSNEFYAVA